MNQSEATKIIDRVAPRGRIPFDQPHEETAAIPVVGGGLVSVDLLTVQEGTAVELDAVVAASRNDAGVVRDVAELDYAAATARGFEHLDGEAGERAFRDWRVVTGEDGERVGGGGGQCGGAGGEEGKGEEEDVAERGDGVGEHDWW